MRNTLATLIFWSCVLPLAAVAGEEGVVADYHFCQGAGETLFDRSGRGNHGRIHGAAWTSSGDSFALRLNGVDAYVDCGAADSLNISRAITVEAWVYPDGVPSAGEPGVVGKSHGNCYSHHHGPFDAKHHAWVKSHWLVFRAQSDHATLRISDGAGPGDPGVAGGQEVILNFVQIQPYDE